MGHCKGMMKDRNIVESGNCETFMRRGGFIQVYITNSWNKYLKKLSGGD